MSMEDRQHVKGKWPWAGQSTAKLLLFCLAASSAFQVTAASWADSWRMGGPNQVPFISPPSPFNSKARIDSKPSTKEHEFTLKHIFHHGTYKHPDLHVRMDMKPEDTVRMFDDDGTEHPPFGTFIARSQEVVIERLSDRKVPTMQSLYHKARLTGAPAALHPSAWTMDEVSGPNTTDKETVVNLAKMSWCAYVKEPGTGEWQDIGGGFNYSQGFGWEGNSLRGYVFADKDNSTIVIALKGTSPVFDLSDPLAVFDGAETTTNDKVNDNLFFGCCCGQGGQYLWHQVCNCMSSAYTCNSTCVVQALREENRYYKASIELYGNVTELYPNSQVWLAGHSLGGSTSALLGLTFGLPVTTFEAPGDALAATRLGLPPPPGSHPSAPQTRKHTGAVHFGHTADPIFMGSCNAATSGCTIGGYAMQTECHTGTVCRYDTVEDKQWRVGIGYHRIRSVVEDVLMVYDDVPPCVPDEECVDCFNWKYFESNSSEPTSTSSSSSSTAKPTRTTTCKTPGWWGCLDDETTTSSATSTSSSTMTTLTTTAGPTTSCVAYGWFGGCLETTTLSPTTKSTAVMLTTSCLKHGWLGLGSCVSATTFFPTPYPMSATPAPGPTVTTTRPLPKASGRPTLITGTAFPSEL